MQVQLLAYFVAVFHSALVTLVGVFGQMENSFASLTKLLMKDIRIIIYPVSTIKYTQHDIVGGNKSTYSDSCPEVD